jgi:hypothetical protein
MAGLGMNGAEWSPADLDRCEHGRHSVDNCYNCPSGWSSGNLYLARIAVLEDRDAQAGEQVRIGTMLGGQPILVVPIRSARPYPDQEATQ